MHSLSLKVFTDLNAGTRRNCFPARVGPGLATDLDFGKRRKAGLGCRHGGVVAGECRIVACAVERNGNGGGGESPSLNPNPTQKQSSFLSRSQTYAMLKQQMEVAAKSEVGFLCLCPLLYNFFFFLKNELRILFGYSGL